MQLLCDFVAANKQFNVNTRRSDDFAVAPWTGRSDGPNSCFVCIFEAYCAVVLKNRGCASECEVYNSIKYVITLIILHTIIKAKVCDVSSRLDLYIWYRGSWHPVLKMQCSCRMCSCGSGRGQKLVVGIKMEATYLLFICAGKCRYVQIKLNAGVCIIFISCRSGWNWPMPWVTVNNSMLLQPLASGHHWPPSHSLAPARHNWDLNYLANEV